MTRTITLAPVRKTIRVKANPARAFEVFTANMTRWWPPTHTILKSALRDTVLEPRVGGRWAQLGEDGSSCEIGYVIAWEVPKHVVLAWQLNADWAFDPKLITEIEVTFTPDGDGTRVDLEHRHIERMGEKSEAVRTAIDSTGGWGAILESFRNVVES